jgi:hypothetical protein
MTPDFFEALTLPTYWLLVVVTLGLIGCAVGLHYEVLERLNYWLPRWSLPARPRVLVLIVGIITVHTVEIWIFGLGIYLMTRAGSMGWVSGVEPFKLLDAVYLSTTTYTTVGYGDLAPHGPIRLILGSEALTGVVLVTWSASFTYLEMQRFWRTRA